MRGELAVIERVVASFKREPLMRKILAVSSILFCGAATYVCFAGGSATSYRDGNIRLGTIPTAVADRTCPQHGHSRLLCLAEALKDTISPTLKARLEIPYAVADARRWSNLPPAYYSHRVGPALNNFSPEQLGLIKAMLQEATGKAQGEGYDELEQILNASDFTKANASSDEGFSSGLYHIAFIGTPAARGVWQLYFGGHHMAVTNTYRDGRLVGGTPSFRAIEPFASFPMNGRINAPLAKERTALAAMLMALGPPQQRQAKLRGSFPDIVVGAQRDSNFPATRSGVRLGNLTPEQKQLALAAIRAFVTDIDTVSAASFMMQYEAELDETYVALSGTPALNAVGDYVRIDGPSVWIEFSMQSGRSFPSPHPHSIWRDRKTDYGGVG